MDKTDRQYLIELAERPICKRMNRSIGEAILAGDLVEDAVSLHLHQDKRIAFRISWGLEYAYFKERDKFIPYAGLLTGVYLQSKWDSVYRVYGKIVLDLLLRHSEAAWKRMDELAEKAFDIMVSPEVKVAPKVWAMEILYLLYDKLEWVAENLVPTLEHQAVLFPSPAMTNHTGKVLRRLQKKR